MNTATNNKTANDSSIEAAPAKLLFSPGQVVATPGAIALMNGNQIQSLSLLVRHLTGDWGAVPSEDAKANLEALKIGARILSSYPLEGGARIWIITAADRSSTTFLLPEEY
ncbi:MAG: hypothetical protein PHH11_09580 [Methylomonas sp.]|nr:hypothetical protein [Methylomonas sp.]